MTQDSGYELLRTLTAESVLASLAYYPHISTGAISYQSIESRFSSSGLSEKAALFDLVNSNYGGITNVELYSSNSTGLTLFTTAEVESGRIKIVLNGTNINLGDYFQEGLADMLANVGIASMHSLLLALDAPVLAAIGLGALASNVAAAISYVESEVTALQQQGLSRSEALAKIDLIGHSKGGFVGALVLQHYQGQLGNLQAFSAPLLHSDYADRMTLTRSVWDPIGNALAYSFNGQTYTLGAGAGIHSIAALSTYTFAQLVHFDQFIESSGMTEAERSAFRQYDWTLTSKGELVKKQFVERHDTAHGETFYFSVDGGIVGGVMTMPLDFLRAPGVADPHDRSFSLLMSREDTEMWAWETRRSQSEGYIQAISLKQEYNSLGQLQHVLDVVDDPAFQELMRMLDPYALCFAAGTMIDMADGTLKAIEEICVGDWVLAFEGGGALTPRRVTRTFKNYSRELLVLSNGTRVTPLHPYLNDLGEFQPIRDLVRTGRSAIHRDGHVIHLFATDTVVACYPVSMAMGGSAYVYEGHNDSEFTVFNFTVEGLHTYVADGIRVHNTSILDLLTDGEKLHSIVTNTETGERLSSSTSRIGEKVLRTIEKDGNDSVLITQTIGYENSDATVVQIWNEADGTVVDGKPAGLGDLTIQLNTQFISGEQIGSLFGSTLGNHLGGNAFEDALFSAALGTVFGDLGKAAHYLIADVTVSEGTAGERRFITGPEALDEAFEKFGDRFVSNFVSAGIGQISSFIANEVIGGTGVVADLGRIVANGFISAALSDVVAAAGIQTGGQSLGLFTGQNYNFNPATAIAGYFGTQLANSIISPETQTAAIISGVVSSLGAIVGPGVVAAMAGIKAGATVGSVVPIVGTFIGAFIGAIVGTFFGNILGGSAKKPTARADIYVDNDGRAVAPGTGGAFNDGTVSSMVPMAEGLAATINALLDGLGGDARIDLPNGSVFMSMGYRAQDGYIVGRAYGGHNLWDLAYTGNWDTAFDKARNHPLNDGMITGGDAWGRRVFFYGEWENFDQLLASLQIAAQYRKYLENKEVIDTLIAQAPDSAFAVGWALTLAQAAAMGFTNPYALHNKIEGTAGADTLVGDDRFNNELIGGAGNDTLLGGVGHDLLEGGAGADILNGGAGEDTASYKTSTAGVYVNLLTGIGTGGHAEGDTFISIERLIGSVHADTLIGDDGDNVLAGMAGDDTIYGGAGDDIIEGGAGADTMDGGEGFDIANYGTSSAGVKVSLQEGSTPGQGFGGDAEGDTLMGFEGISGSIFSDILIGNSEDNVLIGNAGNDILAGLGGADTLIGGDGSDFADYSASDAAVYVNLLTGVATGGHAEGDRFSSIENLIGSDFDDTLIGDNFGNIIEGGAGADWLDGGGGMNVLSYATSDAGVNVNLITNTVSGGHAEGDTIQNFTHVIGSHFDDYIVVGHPDAIVLAGAGNDIIVPYNGNARIDGGDGYDMVSFENVDKGTYFTGFQRGEMQVFQGEDIYAVWDATKAGQKAIHSHFLGDRYLVELNSIEWLRATEFDDIIDFDDIDQYVLAGAGNDIMRGREGNDVFDGGSGDDHLVGGLGDDWLIGGEGDDILDGDGDRNVFQPLNPDNIFIPLHADIPWGNDRLDGGAGNDLLRGNGGDDTYVFGRGYGHDTIHDVDYETVQTGTDTSGKLPWPILSTHTIDAGNDTLEFGPDIFPSDLVAARQGDDLILFLKDSDDRITIKNWTDPNQRIETFYFSAIDRSINVAAWSLNQFSRVFTGAAAPADAADFSHSPAAVTVNLHDSAMDGVANVIGSAFGDTIIGDDGDNIIEGGAGADTLDGGAGFNFISFASAFSGVDVSLTGPVGSNYNPDSAWNSGPVNPYSDALGDVYTNFQGIIGSAFNDTLVGNASDNILVGGKGNDRLYGGTGNDIYRIGLGDGQDLIRDAQAVYNFKGEFTGYMAGGDADIIEFGEGIHLSDIILRTGSEGAANSLLVDISGGQRVEIEHWFTNSGTSYIGRIENFKFANGIDIDLTAIGTVSRINPNNTVNRTIGAGSGKWVIGSAENNDISGAAGNDVLVGGAGNDTLNGGNGNDILVGGAGNDTLNGGNGIDRAVFAGRIADFEITAGTNWIVKDLNPNDGDEGTDTLISIEYIHFDDMIIRTNGNNAPFATGEVDLQIAEENDLFSWTVPVGLFRDIDPGDVLTYSASMLGGAALPSWLSFDAATGTLSGTPNFGDADFHAVQITATDAAGEQATRSFVLRVVHVNDAPIATMTLDDREFEQGAQVSFTIPAAAFTDSNPGDSLIFSAEMSGGAALPAWLSFEGPARRFVGMPTNGDVGDYNIRVIATDNAGASAFIDFAISVSNVNDAPYVSVEIGDQRALEDNVFSFTIPDETFVDIDTGDVLSLSVTLLDGSALPSWLVFDELSRTLSGTPDFEDVGELSIKVTATDNDGLSVSTGFLLIVDDLNDAPVVVVPLEDRSALQGTAFELAIPPGTFEDVDVGDILTLSASMSDGTDLPDWLYFDAVSGKLHGLAGNAEVGVRNIRIIATDIEGATAYSDFAFTVINVNDAPEVSIIPAAQVAIGADEFIFALPSGTFTDVDEGDILTYSAWLFDGSPLPSWLSFNAETLTFSGTPSDSDTGTYMVGIVATDLSGASASTGFSLEVLRSNNAPTVIQPLADGLVEQDASFSYEVPANTFEDTDPDEVLTYSALLASGEALPAWLSFDAATRTFSGTPDNADVGTYTIHVVATDIFGASVSASLVVAVENVNDAPVVGIEPAAQDATQDQTFSFALPEGTFLDIDAGDILSYSASLSDGSPLPSWLSFDAATQTFSGTPTNSDVGEIDIRVSAEDLSGATAFADFTLAVANVNDAPVVVSPLSNLSTDEDALVSYTVPVDTFADPDVGDTLVYAATRANGNPLPGWLSFDAATQTFSGTPSNDHVGNLDLQVIATDSAGASVSTNFVLTVVNTNDAPVASMALVSQSAAANQAFSYTVPSGAFTDVDAGDVLTYSAMLSNGDALPAWLVFDPATRTLSGTPPVSSSPNYTIRITATDLAGSSASSTFGLSVTTNEGSEVYDGVALTGLIDGGPGNDTVSYATAPSAVTVNLATGGSAGAAAGDTYLGIENIIGSAYNDTLIGNAADNIIMGGGGADAIDGKGGFDWASYADAAASINANLTAGTVVTGGVTDTLISIEGIIGSAFNDIFTGTAGADAFRGNGGIDQASGGAGDDTYYVDLGGRTVINDVVFSQSVVQSGKYVSTYESTLGNAGQDTVVFGEGIDIADIIVAQTESFWVIQSTDGPLMSPLPGGIDLNITILDDLLVTSSANLATGDGVTIGGWFAYAQLMHTITNPTSGHTRVETFVFANGLEISVGGISAVASDLDDVSSTWTGTAANEWYSGRGGDDVINGGGGNDILIGGAGNDTINGGNGNDVLVGGSGNDILRGGAGYDIYSFGRDDDQDTIQQNNADANGGLLIFGEDIRHDQLWFAQSGQNLVVSVIGTTDQVTVAGFFGAGVREVTEFRAGGFSLDTSATSSAVQQLVSAMAAFSPPSAGQMELNSEIRNDTNVSTALAAWAA